eukprot:SAG22_NODE_2546_length_2458_cov_2.805002_3_plen_236_part_00
MAGNDEAAQVAYLKQKIDDTGKLVSTLETNIADMTSKLDNLMSTMEKMGGEFLDKIARGDTEKNISVKETFNNFAEQIEKLCATQASQIGRLKGIAGQLQPFASKCKTANTAVDEYVKAKDNLERKTKAAATAKGKRAAMAEKELEGAQKQEQVAAGDLSKIMQDFENDRTTLLKVVLGDFIHLHIEYHAKALERFTEMYRDHDAIYPDDLEDLVGLGNSRPALEVSKQSQSAES